MTKIELPPYRTVWEAAKKAFEEGRLGFQNGEIECKYHYDTPGVCCAIGAALSDEEAGVLRDQYGDDAIIDIVEAGVPNLVVFTALQEAHDSLCGSAKPSLKEADQRFAADLERLHPDKVGLDNAL